MQHPLAGIWAAWMLARFRPEGLALLSGGEDARIATAARSFWALALAIPGFIALHLIGWLEIGIPASPARNLIGALTGFVVGWLGFLVIVHALAIRTGRGRQWPGFVAIWNWCSLVQQAMLLAACLPGLLGLPAIIGQVCWLVALGWAIWLEWYAMQLTLTLRGRAAAALVVMDIALGLTINSLVG
jgi:hypothetical protein